MTIGRATAAAILLAAAVAPVVTATQPASTAGRVLRVTNNADDATTGTLRWAIEASNATADRDTITIDPIVIALKSPLPAIEGPVQIEGAAWRRSGEFAVIDGAGYIAPGGPEGCPGATSGQSGANVRTMTSPGLRLIDTADIEISGIEVRRFCIGVLINRSMRVTIHDTRIVANHGGSGIMLTGDDGQGNPTSTTTNNNKVLRNEFVDNGDGLELTRGAAFNLIADNIFRSTDANPEPSQGLEILRGNDNVVTGNHFEGYSDGLQINWGDRNYIAANTFRNNTFGLNLTGVGNVVEGNVITGNRIGVVVRPADPSPVVRLTRNRIFANGKDIRRCEAGGSCDAAAPKGAIVMGLPGLEHSSFVGSRGRGVTVNASTIQYICPDHAPKCQPAPNHALGAPILTAAKSAGHEIVVTGTIKGQADARYVVELFGNGDASAAESEFVLEQTAVVADAAGVGTFTVRIGHERIERLRSLTATMTSADGATSALSAALPIKALPSR